MKIGKLRTNRMETPLGFAMDSVRVSWVVTDTDAKKQEAARVAVSMDSNMEQMVYDTGRCQELDSICTELDIQLLPRTRYYWKVWVWADNGEMAESEVTWFETAKAEEPWEAEWITADFAQDIHPVLRKTFQVNGDVVRSRIYILGLGVYECWINGEKVGDEYLMPGLHAYDSWLQYQTYELDVKQGENLLEVHLGDGWYKGAYGLKSRLPRHGDEFALIAEARIAYEDGREEVVGSDLTWSAGKDMVVLDRIYDGEVYDASMDRAILEEVYPVRAADIGNDRLHARLSPPLRIQERIIPIEVIQTPAGETVLDMGQNMVGWLEFDTSAPAGTKIHLQYGEILQDGNFYRDNMRTAKCEYTYISDGKPAHVRPHYTFYGFRFVKVEGWDKEVKAEDFSGAVIYSTMEKTGQIETSDPRINRLFDNVIWGQKGNFLDIPTDCPQRDERMGWTGDAQIFADTASYNMDTYAFYAKFGKDLAEEQIRCEGSVPFVVPMSSYDLHGASVWGDAATVIPWQTYVHFGDKDILKQQYGSMKAWVEYMKQADDAGGGRRLWTSGRHFGDWLALDGKAKGGVYGRTDIYFISSVFYYYSSDILSRAADVLGMKAEADVYKKLADEIKTAVREEYFTGSGRLAVNTQTAYALAVYMDLFPEAARERTYGDFRTKLRENGFEMETGFVGTPFLCQALSKCGHNDVAYKLVFRREYPGWLYEVDMGATTIWERWDSVLPDGKISGTGMNSLNHYTYGSVAAWMYRYMVGIQPVEHSPGFRKAVIAPMPDYHLQWARASVDTPCGTYKAGWSLDGGRLTVTAVVPFGGEAKVILPASAKARIEGIPGGVEVQTEADGSKSLELAAGTYELSYEPDKPYREVYSLESDVNELLAIPELKEIIAKYFPRAVRGIVFQDEMSSLQEVIDSPFSEAEEEAIRAMERELMNYVGKDR